LSFDAEVHAKAVEAFKGNEKVGVSFARQDMVSQTEGFKEDLLKTFIRQTHKLLIPETDLKIYKLSAFDDFQGFIMPFTYPDIDISPYSLILLPVLSSERWPEMASDCFYSAICFLARERKVPLIGLQIQPPLYNAIVYFKLMDYIVVKEEWERRYLERHGLEKERIFLLTDEREVYCLKSIEDRYKSSLLELMDNKENIKIDKREFCIIVFNHPKFRFLIMQVLSAIAQLNINVVVFLVKFGYSIKELDEQDVINNIYGDIIKKIKDRVYYADSSMVDRILALADVLVSATYREELSLAVRYGKASVVYNGLSRDVETGDDVIFSDNEKELNDLILRRYNEKKAGYRCLSDLLDKVCTEKKSVNE